MRRLGRNVAAIVCVFAVIISAVSLYQVVELRGRIQVIEQRVAQLDVPRVIPTD